MQFQRNKQSLYWALGRPFKNNETNPFLILVCLILAKMNNVVDAPHAQLKQELGTQLWPVVAYATDLAVVDPIHLDEKMDKIIQLLRTSFGMATQKKLLGGGPQEVTATHMLVIEPIRMVRNQLL